MLKVSYLTAFFVALLLLLASYVAVPNFLAVDSGWFWPKAKLHFGLDLRGGSFITMQVDFEGYMSDFLDTVADDARSALDKRKIAYKEVYKNSYAVVARLSGAERRDEEKEAFRDMHKNFDVDFSTPGEILIQPRKNYLRRLKRDLLLDSIGHVRKRIDAMGIGDIAVQMKGGDSVLLQIPATENVEKIKKIIGTTSKMTFHLIHDPSAPRKDGMRRTIMKARDRRGRVYEVYRKVELEGNLLKQAFATYDSGNRPAVGFVFNSAGARKFAALTKNNTGSALAIMIDGVVMTAPVIREPIVGGRGEITGDFDIEGATDLAIMLRSGALPASLKVVEERFIGPTLGESSVLAGKKSMAVSFAGISIMMIFCYKIFGVLAVISLFFNIILVIAALTLMQAVLTLPGIAGIVLTIGMAVDGNIIIFERIMDEARQGRGAARAIDSGFSNATATIVDSNLTTLICALILFLFGAGPVRGFAVTLGVGVVTTLFSNVVINRVLVYAWFGFQKNIKIALR